MSNIMRYYDKTNLSPRVVEVFGRFAPSTEAVAATYTFPVASGTDILLDAVTAGAAGNAKRFTAVADGNVSALLDLTSLTSNIDSTVTFGTAGVGGNLAKISVIPVDFGGPVAAGGYIREDTTAGSEELEVLVNINSGNECTVTQFQTLVGTSTNFTAAGGTGANTCGAGDYLAPTLLAGGTAATWAAYAAPTLTLHYTDGVSTVDDAVTEIVALAATSGVTSASTDTNLLAGADALAAQALSGGVDAVAYDSANTVGEGFTVARTGASGTGEYTITFDRGWADAQLLSFEATVQLPTAEATLPQASIMQGLYDSSAKTLVLTTYDKTAAGVIDLIYAAGRYIHFTAKFIVNR